MKSSITLEQLRSMKNDCAKGGCYYCDYKHDCDSYTDEDIMPPVNWMLPNTVNGATTLKTLTAIHKSCITQASCLDPSHCAYADSNARCMYRDNTNEMEPCEWILPTCDSDSTSPITTEQTKTTINMSELSTEELLNELQRREVSPNLMERIAVEQHATQFKKDHLDVIKAAITIHNYCESTEEYRHGRCDKCFLYDSDTDECGVGWSEKQLDANILRLCTEYKDLK